MSPPRSPRSRSSGSPRNRPGRSSAQRSGPKASAGPKGSSGSAPPGRAGAAPPAPPSAPAPVDSAGAPPGWLTRAVSAVPERVRELALIISGAVVSVWAAVLLSVAGAFLTPLRIGTVPVPVSVLLSIGGNALIMWFAYRVTRIKVLAVLPGVLWVALTFVASGATSERDVVLLGNWVPIVYLYGGCATVAILAYRLFVPRPPT